MIPEKDIRICFVGESFVNGTGDRTHLGWTGRLCQTLSQGDAHITYYNLGVRRETSTELLERWQPECDRRLPPGCHHRVVFCFGVNDTSLENGKPRVSLMRSLTNTRTILSDAQRLYSVLMVGPAAVADDDHNARSYELSEHFAQLCEELEVPYLHVLPALTQSTVWMSEVNTGDGAHPGAGGYAELARIVQDWSAWNALNSL